MKNLITLILIALAIQANAQTRSIQKSAPLSYASPESAGMSAERLNRIDAMCRASVKEGDLPGVVALIVQICFTAPTCYNPDAVADLGVAAPGLRHLGEHLADPEVSFGQLEAAEELNSTIFEMRQRSKRSI